jgi:hypothetical protein
MSVAMPTVEEQPRVYTSPNGAAASNGRLRVQGLTESERNFAVATHLSPFGALIIGPLAFLAPLVLWLVRKDHSTFNDDHGREIVNFMISVVLLAVCTGITIVGLLFWPVLAVVAVVSPIRAAVAAGRGEYFRYPMTFRFL